MITQVFTNPFTDHCGNNHKHDKNIGRISVICANGHSTKQDYIATCECGWKNGLADRENASPTALGSTPSLDSF